MDPRSDDNRPMWGASLYPTKKVRALPKPKVVAKQPKSLLKRKDIKILLVVRELLRRQARSAEQKVRAQTIKQVNKADFLLPPTSIESYLHRVLLTTEEPMHIKDIIPQAEALGWETAPIDHKYAQVYRAMRLNDYMFLRVGKNKFRLRDGFRNKQPDKIERKITDRERFAPNYVPTLLDLIVGITKRYSSPRGIYPARVHYIMNCMGANAPCYSTIYRTMQCETFVRDGQWYKLNDTRSDSKQDAG